VSFTDLLVVLLVAAGLVLGFLRGFVAEILSLFAWILAIPYLIISSILFYLAEILAFFAFFTILFAKKYPEGMFKIALVGLRWQARGNAYAYWLTTKYPPFVWA
jgi:hypothetical protein